MPGVPHSTNFTLISFTSSFFAVAISSRYRVHSGKLNFGLLLKHKYIHTCAWPPLKPSQPKIAWVFQPLLFEKVETSVQKNHVSEMVEISHSIWVLHYIWPLTFSLCNWVFYWGHYQTAALKPNILHTAKCIKYKQLHVVHCRSKKCINPLTLKFS